jgi:predicted component of type VI protein secretion system
MEQDIQLSGLGIQPEHCVIIIEDGGLFMEPLSNARSYVNGLPVTERIPLHHGDRIMWGNHHFFRVNCPKSAGSISCHKRYCTLSICAASAEPSDSEPFPQGDRLRYSGNGGGASLVVSEMRA